MKERENKPTFCFGRKFYTHPSTHQYPDHSISQGFWFMTDQWVIDALALKLLDQRDFFLPPFFKNLTYYNTFRDLLDLEYFYETWNLSTTSDHMSAICFHCTPLLHVFCKDYGFFRGTHFLYVYPSLLLREYRY